MSSHISATPPIIPTTDLDEVTRELKRYKRELATGSNPKKYKQAKHGQFASFRWEEKEAASLSNTLPASSEATISKFVLRRGSFTFTR